VPENRRADRNIFHEQTTQPTGLGSEMTYSLTVVLSATENPPVIFSKHEISDVAIGADSFGRRDAPGPLFRHPASIPGNTGRM
jgi:hypothetical protein